MKIKDKVEYILKNYPSTRNSDQELILMVWWHFHKDLMQEAEGDWWIRLRNVKVLEKPETLTRARRKFQEEGKYEASPEIKRKRGKLEDNMQMTMPKSFWGDADYLNQ